MKRYERYKDSGIEWIGEIPEHWDLSRLRFLSNIVPSNIDKKSKEGEQKVLLCNYVDVYKNDTIDRSIDFMEATASDLQIEKLTLRKDDVIATKDSEDPKDIGVPALVKESLENVVYGYHLTLIRTRSEILIGTYLYWLLCSTGSNQYFFTEARGITRYAIGSNVFKNLQVTLPPYEEQTKIAKYLARKSVGIDSLITKKKKLISLLKEERAAIINQALTKGIDSDAKYKDSGIEWIGQTPEHWAAARIKNVGTVIGRIGFRGYTIADIVSKESGVVSLSPGNIKNHTLDLNSCTYLSREKYHESPEIMIFENDIVLVKTGSTIGKVAFIPQGTPEMTLNPQLVVLKDISIENAFLYYLMISKYFQSYFKIYTAGGSTPAISQEKINNFKIIFPDSVEQKKIVTFIEAKTSKIDITIAKIKNEIALIKEYKRALINDVVTGKIDIRDAIEQNLDKLQEAHQ